MVSSEKQSNRPVTDDDRRQIVALYQEGGYSVRGLAKELKRSPTTISRVLRGAGVQTWRGECVEAVEQTKLRANQRRLQIAEELLEDVELLRERAWGEYELPVNTDKGVEVVLLDEPPLKEQADAYRAVNATMTTVGKVLDDVNDSGVSSAKSVLSTMLTGLQQLMADDPDAGLGPNDQDQD